MFSHITQLILTQSAVSSQLHQIQHKTIKHNKNKLFKTQAS